MAPVDFFFFFFSISHNILFQRLFPLVATAYLHANVRITIACFWNSVVALGVTSSAIRLTVCFKLNNQVHETWTVRLKKRQGLEVHRSPSPRCKCCMWTYYSVSGWGGGAKLNLVFRVIFMQVTMIFGVPCKYGNCHLARGIRQVYLLFLIMHCNQLCIVLCLNLSLVWSTNDWI